MAPETLLETYDRGPRGVLPPPVPGVRREYDGPLLRVTGLRDGMVVVPRDPGLTTAALDALVARQRAYFAARAMPFQWRTHGHDLPPDLTDRLRAAGLSPASTQTVMLGRCADLTGEVPLPPGVRLREVTSRRDLRRIVDLVERVWAGDWAWLADHLYDRLAAAPGRTVVTVAEAEGRMVSVAWLVLHPDGPPGTNPGSDPEGHPEFDFAGLRGGTTLPEWRGRGLYRALVAARARSALERGVRHVMVDASADSEPVLRGLGLEAATTVTGYQWAPDD
ncbi:GNAT family N-acetyltransferase [Streptomyces sp. NPDC005438]|uniref:GNAT family N-acetyltransferase n=1 Tax=Streptomyces sp. NPDC005438 TaxID=3156880 RepID=UPI0033B6A6DF